MSDSIALPLPAQAAPARAPVNKWLVTVSVSFGTLMGAIDASIVNVALTHIRGAVGATLEEITWISTGFAAARRPLRGRDGPGEVAVGMAGDGPGLYVRLPTAGSVPTEETNR
jgi:hypothetical protein